MKYYIDREFDFCAAHRLLGHENKCSMVHGHNYKVKVLLMASSLDSVGRVVDFAQVKKMFGGWLDEHWDHRTLLYKIDPLCYMLQDFAKRNSTFNQAIGASIVPLEFNPTAENMSTELYAVFSKLLYDNNLTPRVVIESIHVRETEAASAIWA